MENKEEDSLVWPPTEEQVRAILEKMGILKTTSDKLVEKEFEK